MSSPPPSTLLLASTLKPYLTLPQLITLAPLASPIISLIFVAFRLASSNTSAQDSIQSAKNTLTASCLAAERAATVGASLPRFMAESTNQQLTDAVRGTMEGARIALTLSLTVVQGLIEFVIDIYRSTLLCFLELVIRGGLAIIIGAVSEITDFLNTTLSRITSGIADDIETMNRLIRSAIDAVNFLGVNINVPQITIPTANQLASIQVPTTFEDNLRTLNDTIPTLADIREKLDAILAIPFNNLKAEINETFTNAQQNFIATPLPIPEASTVSFCGQLQVSVVDDLSSDISELARNGIILMAVGIIVLIIGNTALMWYSQRSLRIQLERARDQWITESTIHEVNSSNSLVRRSDIFAPSDDNLLTMAMYIEHPLWSRLVYFLSGRLGLSRPVTDAMAWFGAYAFHPAALTVLFIGLFGLLSVEAQLLIAKPLETRYSTAVATSIQDFSTTIAQSINESMGADSKAYAAELNAKVQAVQEEINTDLFGWVNGTTTNLNNTLNAFYEDIQEAVDTVFGGTILETPAQDFVRCLIGSKIEAIENALTFLHDNLNIDIPTVNDNVLMLSQNRVDDVVKPISAAAVGSDGENDDGGIIGKIVQAYVKALEKERFTFLIFVAIWFAVALLGLTIVAWHLWGEGAWFLFRKRRWQKNNPTFHDGLTPWHAPEKTRSYPSSFHSGERDEKSASKDLRSFTPLPASSRPIKAKNRPTASPPSTLLQVESDQNSALRQRRPSVPQFERSWDSFLDSKSSKETKPGSKLDNLRALGRRATKIGNPSKSSDPYTSFKNTPPPFTTGDNEDKDKDSDAASAWFKRLTIWKKSENNGAETGDNLRDTRASAATDALLTVPHARSDSLGDEGMDYEVAPSRRPRPNPNHLSIDTERVSSQRGNLPSSYSKDTGRGSPMQRNASARSGTVPDTAKSGNFWDLMMPPPPMPVADPKRLIISSPMPLQAKKKPSPTHEQSQQRSALPSRPNQHVPRKSGSEKVAVEPKTPGPAPVDMYGRRIPPEMGLPILPIPLHYNFPMPPAEQQPSATRETRPLNVHKRTSSVPGVPVAGAGAGGARVLRASPQASPLTRTSPTLDPFADPRKSAVVVNPFATPFDDSNAVSMIPPRWPTFNPVGYAASPLLPATANRP